MNKGNGDIKKRRKQFLLPNIMIIKIDRKRNCQRGTTTKTSGKN